MNNPIGWMCGVLNVPRCGFLPVAWPGGNRRRRPAGPGWRCRSREVFDQFWQLSARNCQDLWIASSCDLLQG